MVGYAPSQGQGWQFVCRHDLHISNSWRQPKIHIDNRNFYIKL